MIVLREGAATFNYKRPRLTATTPVGEEQPAHPAPTSAPTPGASRTPDSDHPRQRDETGRDNNLFSSFDAKAQNSRHCPAEEKLENFLYIKFS